MTSDTLRRSGGSKAGAPPAPPRPNTTTAMETTNDVGDDDDNLDTSSSSSSDDDAKPSTEQQPPPFYDPHADSEDEAYLNERAVTTGKSEKEDEQLMPSDATLNCPACFSTLTRLSQRHERDPGVWRSVFVEEDAVNVFEGISSGRAPATATAATKGGKKRGRGGDCAPEPTASPFSRGGKKNAELEHEEEDLPRVACSSCEEVVGCLEEDGVFIFFNVIPSA